MVDETTKELRQDRGNKFMNRNIINRLAFGDILRRNAEVLHDKEFAVSYGYGSSSCLKGITYGEMDEMANQFANALIEIGLQKVKINSGQLVRWMQTLSCLPIPSLIKEFATLFIVLLS